MPVDLLLALLIGAIFAVVFVGFFRPKTMRPFLAGFLAVAGAGAVAILLWRLLATR